MTGIISVNVKKIKMTTRVNSLVGENYRDEETAGKYDNGHRIIDTGITKDNVFLLERPGDYDRMRKDRIDSVNEERASRGRIYVKGEKERQREAGTLQAEATRKAVKTRKLRSDTVDTLGLVVQPSADFINSLDRAEQTRFFRDSLEVMQKHPDWFGKIETAVIHYDENTPHMQCLASTINLDTLTSDAKKIVGNKTKMSDRQTLLADEMQAKGWDVERGLKRVNNPEYKNWKDEMEAQGFKVNRHNDRKLMEERKEIKAERMEVQAERMANDTARARNETDRATLDVRNERLDAKEAQLNAKEIKLNAKESKLDRKEKALKEREDKLSTDIGEYNGRVASLNAQIRNFEKERREFAEEKEKALKRASEELETRFNEQQAQLERQKIQLSAREAKLKDGKKSLENSKRRASEEIKSMAAYVGSLSTKELEKRKTQLKSLEEIEEFEKMVNQIDNMSQQMGI